MNRPVDGGRAGQQGFDAFISYSHAADGRLAPAVQLVLQGLAKPWWKLRSLRVFRDKTSLSATPALWGSIEAALERSRYFILLASPSAARSSWVNRELEWWCDHRGTDTVLIALTAGALPWGASAPAEVESALPDSLAERLTGEPLWVDLRWAAERSQLSSRDPRFRQAVATLGAAVVGQPLDQIIGNDVRQHRRTMVLARLAVAVLVCLTGIALVAARFAYVARDDARAQATIATSRQLAVEATSRLDHDLGTAQLLAAAGLRTLQTPETEQALLRSAYSSPHLDRLLDESAIITSLVLSQDGKTAYVGGSGGELAAWDLAAGQRRTLPILRGLVNSLALSPDGSVLVAGSDTGQVSLIDLHQGSSAELPRLTDGPVFGLAVSEDNDYVAAGGSDLISLYSVDDRRRVTNRHLEPSQYTAALFFTPEETLVAGLGEGGAQILELPSLRAVPGVPFAFDHGAIAYTRSGGRVAAMLGGQIFVGPLVGATTRRLFATVDGWLTPRTIAVSDNARRVVISDDQRIAIVDSAKGSGRLRLAAELTGTPGARLLAVDSSGTTVVSARGAQLAVWDLSGLPPAAQQVRSVAVEQADGAPAAVLKGDRVLAYVEEDIVLWDLQTETVLGRLPDPESSRPDVRPLGERIEHVAVSRSLDQVAVPVRGAVRIYTVANGRASYLRTIRVGDDDAFMEVAFNGPRIVVLSTWNDREDAAVQEFDIASGRRLSSFTTAQTTLTADGSTLLGPKEDGSMMFTSVVNQEASLVHSPHTHHKYDELASWAISGDGSGAVVQLDSGHIDVWDLRTRTVANSFELGDFRNIRLSGDGSTMLAEDTSTVEIWPTAGQAAVAEIAVSTLPYERERASVALAAFRPDGKAVYTLLDTGTIIRWTLDPVEWLDIACTRAGHELTVAEWNRLVGTTPPDDLRCRSR